MLPLHTNCVHSHPSPAEELYNSSMTESQIVPSVRPQSHSCHFPCSLVNFYPQGWNQPGWIILGREFSSAGMKWAGKNHPCGRIFIRRDEMSEEESSLREIFHPQGWNQPGRIILGRDFLSADNMKWPHICSIADSPLYYVWSNHSKMVYRIQKEVTNE